MIFLSTKNCPFCGKEISDEAIICKFCHRLLIDENGKDIEPDDADIVNEEEEITEEPETEAAGGYEEDQEDDSATKVFSPDDVKKALAKQQSENNTDPEYDDYYDNEAPANENEYSGNDEDYYDAPQKSFGGEENAPLSEDEFFQEFGFKPKKGGSASIASDEYDPKRTFMITAIITVGILLVIIAAIAVGYKLFGFGSSDKSSTGTITKSNTSSVASAADSQAAPAGDSTETAPVTDESGYTPAVTDDTLSENPEDITNSSLSDPVTYTDSALSAASSDTDSSSAADLPTDSTADSTADSTTDSSETTESYDAGFSPSGNYYSWDEAMTIMSNYASANGIENYYYYGGTDGVEMLFSDDNGQIYRVDLQTGAVTYY